ncbi:MAG: hypothetical protein ACMUEM_04075 [Flavobacteriales bacterium AspAUS03]
MDKYGRLDVVYVNTVIIPVFDLVTVIEDSKALDRDDGRFEIRMIDINSICWRLFSFRLKDRCRF